MTGVGHIMVTVTQKRVAWFTRVESGDATPSYRLHLHRHHYGRGSGDVSEEKGWASDVLLDFSSFLRRVPGL